MGGLWERRSGGIALFPMKCWQEKWTRLCVMAPRQLSALGGSSTGPAAPGNAPRLPVRGCQGLGGHCTVLPRKKGSFCLSIMLRLSVVPLPCCHWGRPVPSVLFFFFIVPGPYNWKRLWAYVLLLWYQNMTKLCPISGSFFSLPLTRRFYWNIKITRGNFNGKNVFPRTPSPYRDFPPSLCMSIYFTHNSNLSTNVTFLCVFLKFKMLY